MLQKACEPALSCTLKKKKARVSHDDCIQLHYIDLTAKITSYFADLDFTYKTYDKLKYNALLEIKLPNGT